MLHPGCARVAAGACPLVKAFCSFLEPSPGNGAVQRIEMFIDLARQRRSHLAGSPGASACAGSPGVVQQYCPPFGRILDFGKAVAAGRHAPNRQQQQAGGYGLAQEPVKPCASQPFAFLGPAVGGQRDDARRKLSARLIADALPGRQSVHIGHVQVHQHDVEAPFAATLHGLETASCQLQGSHRRRQRGLYEVAVYFMVVHRQHGETFDFPAARIAHGPQYNRIKRGATTLPTRNAVMLLAAACWLPSVAAFGALTFELRAGSTTFGEFGVESISVRQTDATAVDLAELSHKRLGVLGTLEIRCPVQGGGRCSEGRLTWNREQGEPVAFGFERQADRITLAGDNGGRVALERPGRDRTELSLEDVPADWMPTPVLGRAGFAALSGRLSGALALDTGRVHGNFRIRELAFDTPDGLYAGADLALDIGLAWLASEARLELEADWSAGELLLGPAYLPSPEASLSLNLQAQDLGREGWRIERLALEQADAIAVTADGLVLPGDPLHFATLDLNVARADLGSLWRQGARSVAGTRGWGQLDPAGTLSGRMRVENDSLASAGLRLADVTIDDDADRIAVSGLDAWLAWDGPAQALDIGANWQDARLLRIPLGASALALRTDAAGTLSLVDSFRLPVLEGALVVDRLAWRNWARAERQLALDARLEPVDLAALTRALGWTEFGGRLSGNFPGIQLSDGVFEVLGGLDIDLFGGRAQVNRLSIERPFGSLPALAAEIEFDSLDLEQVTGAFEFGRMLGLMSGYVHDLRLLDWQPVRFDAWFETLEDSPAREISQKAVDSISSLSGGGGAAISGTLLRWFDDFPYRKAGLGCRLDQNVCRMRGLRDVDNGGYMILEGRLVPRLDIVGYQRRVDWPRLLAQLAAASQSAE